jgi:hypothetical protein
VFDYWARDLNMLGKKWPVYWPKNKIQEELKTYPRDLVVYVDIYLGDHKKTEPYKYINNSLNIIASKDQWRALRNMVAAEALQLYPASKWQSVFTKEAPSAPQQK